MPEAKAPPNLFVKYGLLLVSGTLLIALAALLGYLARWVPTWSAFAILLLIVLPATFFLTKRQGWLVLWAALMALGAGIGGAAHGSNDRKEAAADELGPVSLSVVDEHKEHEAFHIREVVMGEVEFEFNPCSAGQDCYFRTLISMRPQGSAPDVPIRHWIEVRETDSFNDRYVFSRISLSDHESNDLQAACKARKRTCVVDEKAAFFEPVRPSDQKRDTQDDWTDELSAYSLSLGLLWGLPVLIAWGRAWWRRSLGHSR